MRSLGVYVTVLSLLTTLERFRLNLPFILVINEALPGGYWGSFNVSFKFCYFSLKRLPSDFLRRPPAFEAADVVATASFLDLGLSSSLILVNLTFSSLGICTNLSIIISAISEVKPLWTFFNSKFNRVYMQPHSWDVKASLSKYLKWQLESFSWYPQNPLNMTLRTLSFYRSLPNIWMLEQLRSRICRFWLRSWAKRWKSIELSAMELSWILARILAFSFSFFEVNNLLLFEAVPAGV